MYHRASFLRPFGKSPGIYQHCGENHLHRYLAEYDFRYTYRVANGYDDGLRSVQALQGIVGKRLTYQQSGI